MAIPKPLPCGKTKKNRRNRKVAPISLYAHVLLAIAHKLYLCTVRIFFSTPLDFFVGIGYIVIVE